MGKPPIIGMIMGVAGVAGLVFLALLFFSKPGSRTRTPAPAPGKPAPLAATAPVTVPATAPVPESAPEPPPLIRPRPPRRAKRHQPSPVAVAESPEPPLQAVFTVKDTTPPKLRVISPRSPVYLMTDLVTIRARSEPGARLKVDGHPFLETATGVYVAKMSLKPGLNQLNVSAADAVGNTSRAALLVTYIDRSRIHKVKDNLMSLLKQLEEIKQSVDEVDAQTEQIINAIADTEDADRVNELSKNLREIRKNKRTLQKEIERAFLEINSLLEKS